MKVHFLRQPPNKFSQELHTFSCCIWYWKYWTCSSILNIAYDAVDVFLILHLHRYFIAVLFHYIAYLLQILFEDFCWSDVDLGHDNENRQIQSQRACQMLFRHLWDAHVCTDDEEAVIWVKSCETVHCCFQVFLMATHVEQVNDLRRVTHDVWPYFVLLLSVGDLRYVLCAISLYTHYFVSNWRSPSILLLMLKIEDLRTHGTPSIIETPRRRSENSWCRWLTRVDISKHRNPYIFTINGYFYTFRIGILIHLLYTGWINWLHYLFIMKQ